VQKLDVFFQWRQSSDFTGRDANGRREKSVLRLEIYPAGRQDVRIKDSRFSLDTG
jgi:hypothetical protein